MKINLKKIFFSVIILIFWVGQIYSQNAVVGNFSTGWGGACGSNTDFSYFGASAGTTYINTRTVGSTGNKYWRFGVDWGGTIGQYTITIGSDVAVSPSTSYSLNMSCTTSGSLVYNVPNTSYNYVFKTLNAGSSPTGTIVFFEVQGAVQTISSVAQSPTSGNVFPGQGVTVTATTSGTSTGQNFYVRYTNDAWATSSVVAMTGGGTSWSGTIPASANTASKNVSYYVFSSGPSNVATNGSNADLFTINMNNNGGSNYSYTVASGWTTAAIGNWNTAGTWTANAVPSTSESMAAVSILHDVTMNQNATVSSISINSAKTLIINSGSTLTTTGASTIDGTINNAGTMTLSGGSWTFSSSGVYKHNIDGGTLPTATWNNGSTCEITGVTAATSITGINQTFHHFKWNCAGQTSNMQLAGTVPTINGDFTFTTSNAGALRLATSQSPTLNVVGNFSMAAGLFEFATTTGSPIVNISGNYSQTGGTINLAPTGSSNVKTLNIAGNFSISTPGVIYNTTGVGKLIFNSASGTQNFISYSSALTNNAMLIEVGDGATKNPTLVLNTDMRVKSSSTVTVFSGSTFNFGTFAVTEVSATASFIANSGSTLKIGSTAGITSSGATGNVQTTTRTFNSGANYVYIGSANQATGNGLPTTVNTLTIANTGGAGANTVTLTNAGTQTISGTSNSLVLTSGLFSVGSANILSIPSGGTIAATSGNFASGNAAGTLTFAGTGSVSGTVGFWNVNLSNGVNFGANSTINGTLTLNSGAWINTNAPSYASASILKYNTTGTYGRGTEWSSTSGNGYPHHVQISNSTTLDLGNSGTGTARECAGNLTIDDGCTFSMNVSAMTAALTVNGNVVVGSGTSGVLTLSSSVGGDINVKGNWTLNAGATFNHNSRAVTFNGSSGQIINSATTFAYLILNNSAGLSISATTTVDNQLTLTSGLLTLGTNNLILGSACTIGGAPAATNMIVATSTGEVRKTFTGNGSFTFPVGDNTTTAEYSPVYINLSASGYSSAYVGVTLTDAKHASNASTSNYITRYWTLTSSGLTSPSYSAEFSYVDADIVAIETNIYGGLWNASAWSSLGDADDGNNKVTCTAQSNFGDFTGVSYSIFGYESDQDGDWNTAATWLGDVVPPATASVTIKHAVTINAAVVNAPISILINATKSITFGASGTITATTVTNNGSMIMTAGGTLTIATSGTLTNNSTFTQGTGTVVFAGVGTVSGTVGFNKVEIKGGVDFGVASTINNELKISSGGWVNTNVPTYASGSYLKYNTGGTYGRGTEWNATSGAGYPHHVELMNNTTLDLGANAGTGTARQCAGGLTINTGSTLTMATTPMTASLTVIGNISIAGTLILSGSAGGDIVIGGNWTKAGTFTHNSRAVTFNNISTIQHIYSVTTFAYLVIANSSASGVENDENITIVNTLTINSSCKLKPNTSSDLIYISDGGTFANSGTFTHNSGKVIFQGGATVSGTISFYDVDITATGANSGVNFGTTSTIVHYLTMNSWSSVSTNSPLFGASSTLIYNMGGTYSTALEWPGSSSPPNVTIDNGTAVTLNLGSRAISGTLTFTNGTLTLVGNDLTMGATSTISGYSSSYFVIATGSGKLKKTFTGTGSYTYPVGSSGEYSPIVLNFSAGTFGGGAWAGVNVTATKHPNNPSTVDYLERYWTVEKSLISSFTCAVTCTYVDADRAGNEANYYGARRESSSYWELMIDADDASNQFSGTVVSFGDFTCGEQNILSWQTAQDGDWNDPATWVSGIVPSIGANVMISHDITLNSAANNIGLLTIQAGQSLTTGASAAFTVSGAVNINGALDMTAGGAITIGNTGYITNNGTFTAGSGLIYFSEDAYVNGSNHITFNNVTINADVNFGANVSTINGTLEILSQGFVISNSPAFGINSILKYNIGGHYNRVIEWSNPANVWITGNTEFHMNPYEVPSFIAIGDLTVDAGSSFNMDNMWMELIVEGDVNIDGTLTMSSAVGGDLEVKGDWNRTGTFTPNGRLVTFNGTSNQTINDHTTFDYLKMDNSGGANVILNTNIAVNTNLSLEADAIFNTTTYYADGAFDFYLNDGSTLKTAYIEANPSYGTINTRATCVACGCIQNSGTRTFSDKAIYHFIGGADQKGGNGIPTPMDIGGKVIIELTSNTYNYTNSKDISFNTGAILEIRQGTVLDNGSNNFSDASGNTGYLTMSGGIYKFTGTVVYGSSVRYPRFTGTYTLTGGTVDLATTLTSGQYQYVYGGVGLGTNGYYNLKFSGGSVSDGYKIAPSAFVISNNLTITGATTIVEFSNNAITGNAGITMDGGRLRMSKLNSALPELLGISTPYSLTGGVIEFYGSGATQQQQIRGNYNAGATFITYYDLEINASAANYSATGVSYGDAGNVDLNSSFTISHQMTVNSPAVLRMDETDYINGVGNFTIASGAGLLYGSANGIKTSGIGVADGNIRISGTRTFPTDASYGFVSSGNMAAGNGLPATVLNLYAYKATTSNQVTLSQDVTVTGTLTLTSGIITTGTNKVIVSNSATTSVTGATSGSGRYVNGNLQRSTTSGNTYIFPVGAQNIGAVDYGAQGFNFTVTTGNGNILAFMEARTQNPLYNYAYCDLETHPGGGVAHVGEGNVGTDGILDQIEFVNSPLQWDITNPSGGAVSSYNVTFYPNGAQNIASVTSVNGQSVEYTMKNGQPGDDNVGVPHGTALPSFSSEGFLACPNGNTLSGLTTFSKFTKHGAGASKTILPIELINFEAYREGNNININWATSSEKNNNYFTIEKTTNGIDFNEVEKINGAGNSNQTINYSTIDIDESNETIYYRLKQTDFNGKYSYSKIVPVSNFKSANSFEIIDNKIVFENSNQIEIQISDLLGREIYSGKIQNNFDLSNLNLEEGKIMIIKAKNNYFTITKKYIYK